MNEPQIQLYLGHPIDNPTECRVLARLRRDLSARGVSACILANFFAGPQKRQIDLLVATQYRTVHCEIKGYELPVIAAANGPWSLVLPSGDLRQLDGNGSQQALQGTYSISDDLRGIVRRTPTLAPCPGMIYKYIDTVVCLYPRLPPGSQCTRLPHVSPVGYDELLARLTAPGPRLPWTSEQWQTVAATLGLAPPDVRSEEERRRAQIESSLEDYRRRFARGYAAELHELVPLSCVADGKTFRQPDVIAAVRKRQTVSLVGPSGAGKSHMARHAALELTAQGYVVLWLRCGEYEPGKFDVLLSRAVAPFWDQDWRTLLRMAGDAGEEVVIVLDGLNECPASLRPELLLQFSALQLRVPSGAVITTQVSPTLPEVASPVEYHVLPPDAETRSALLSSYGAGGIQSLCEAFSTPYELAIAAECASDLPDLPTTTGLLDAYVRLHARTVATRSVLRKIARMMHEELRTSLPISQVVLALERSPQRSSEPGAIDDALGLPLLNIEYGRVAFRHEQLARFLAAEDLVVSADDATALSTILAQPSCGDLRAYAVGLERDVDRLRHLLAVTTDPDVLTSALAGESGLLAQNVCLAAASGLMAEASFATASEGIEIERDGTMPVLRDYHCRQMREWTPSEIALFRAVGRCLHLGYFGEEVASLLRHTDCKIFGWLDILKAAGEHAPVSAALQAVYASPHLNDPRCAAASVVVAECESVAYRHKLPEAGRIAVARTLAEKVDALSWGRLYLACVLFQFAPSGETDRVPDLLRIAWKAQGVHLRLKALDMVRYTQNCLSSSEHAEVESILSVLDTADPMLNTFLAEVQAAFGLIEPNRTAEEIRAEVASILRSRESPEGEEKALHVLMMRYEDDSLFGPYFSVIDELPVTDRVRLLVMALGPQSIDSFSSHTLLEELVRDADLADPDVRRVILQYARAPAPGKSFIQGAVAAHLVAVRACAAFCDSPPQSQDDQARTPDEYAWRHLDAIAFSLARSPGGLGDGSEAEFHWNALLTEFRSAAVDVLYRVAHAGVLVGHEAWLDIDTLAKAYTQHIRSLLEWGLGNQESLTSLFGDDMPDREERARFIVQTLGAVGDAGTARMLRAYASDPALGNDAVGAIRRIQG